MSDRFFFDGPIEPGLFNLEGPEAHHLSVVRRIGRGERIVLFNGTGGEHAAVVADVGKKRVTLQVEQASYPRRELGFRLHVASALPKGERGDFLIEKLTEVGVTDFTPLITERAIVKPTLEKADKLRRAVIEASKQCGRNFLMQIHPPSNWSEWCVRHDGQRFVAHPDGTATRRHLTNGDVTVAIGPEGGFTQDEVVLALAAGWELMSLGATILRVETAALAAAVQMAACRRQ